MRPREVVLVVVLVTLVAATGTYWVSQRHARAEDAPVDATATVSAPEALPETGCIGRSDHLDIAKLTESVTSKPQFAALSSASFSEIDETNIHVEVAGYQAIITGAGEILIFRFSPEVPDWVRTALHAVAEEVNDAC